eukprot:358454-Chlamydomonas_euryale.AAC.2
MSMLGAPYSLLFTLTVPDAITSMSERARSTRTDITDVQEEGGSRFLSSPICVRSSWVAIPMVPNLCERQVGRDSSRPQSVCQETAPLRVLQGLGWSYLPTELGRAEERTKRGPP